MATFKENALRVIAVVGLIAILLLGAWGIIQLAFIIPGFFSGHGSSSTLSSRETLSLSLPQAVASGENLTISWSHQGRNGEYAYSISYACQDGVSIKAPTPSGSLQAVGCNTPFDYTNAATSATIVPALSGTKAATLNITVAATKLSSGIVTASAAGRVTINPKIATSSTKPTTSTKASSGGTYVAAHRTTNLYGYPDLAVTIMANPGAVRVGSRIALQFVIQNVGTNVAQSGWTFSASLPYNPTYTFTSQPQQALYPGDKIVYTLGYDAQYTGGSYITPTPSGCDGWTYPCTTTGQVVYGGPGTCNSYGPCNVPGYYPNIYGYTNPGYNYQTASIQVDPYNLLWESNETNNYASVSYQVY